MDRQNFKNANGMFPVTTETFDFMQEQILMLGNLARMAGCNVIVKEPFYSEMHNSLTGEVMVEQRQGLVIIADELMPLRVGDGLNAPYVEIVEESENIMVNERSFSPLRTRRYARFTNTETAYPKNSFLPIPITTKILTDMIRSQGNLITELQTTIQEQVQTQLAEQQEIIARQLLPKGTIIDWYPPTENTILSPDTVPSGFVPAMGVGQDYFPGSSYNAWKEIYPDITGICAGTRPRGGAVATFSQITYCNGMGIPNLSGKFLQGGTPGSTGGSPSVILTVDNLPAHKHTVYGYKRATGSSVSDIKNVMFDDNNIWYQRQDLTNLFTEPVGSGESFSILPPYMEVYKLIKVI